MQSPTSLLSDTRPRIHISGTSRSSRTIQEGVEAISINETEDVDTPITDQPPRRLGRSNTVLASSSDVKGKRKAISVVMFSGGTGANSFSHFSADCIHVLPISDDGGSSSEILRCLGGPSIGDIRSRLVRLIPLPSDPSPSGSADSQRAIHDLLAHRFPVDCSEKEARDMWSDLVEGRSGLWKGVAEDRKECIRAILVHFHTLLLRRTHKKFSFRNFSIGNGFLAGCRDMLGGLPAAIFMFRALTDSQNTGAVIPVILTNQTITIAAKLEDGSTIVGQSDISHPPPTLTPTRPELSRGSSTVSLRRRRDSNAFDTFDSAAESSGSSSSDEDTSAYPTYDRDRLTPVSRRSSISSRHSDGSTIVDQQGSPWNDILPEVMRKRKIGSKARAIRKAGWEGEEVVERNSLYVKGEAIQPLESRIERVFYVNNYSAEIYPEPNPELLRHLAEKEVVLYAAGSLWTSIVPCIALRGVASAIARSPTLKAKVLLLNSCNDRETPSYTASDYITVISRMLNWYNRPKRASKFPGDTGRPKPPYAVGRLVSHLVYLEGGEVRFDLGEIEAMGVKVVKVPKAYGKKFTNETVEYALECIRREWV